MFHNQEIQNLMDALAILKTKRVETMDVNFPWRKLCNAYISLEKQLKACFAEETTNG